MEVGIFGLIRNEEGKILLVQDATRQRKWGLPGGGLKFKEIPTHALVREVKEEVGVEAHVGKLLGIFAQQKTPGIVILFEAVITNGKPQPDGKEVAAWQFLSLDEMLIKREEIKPAQLSMVFQVLRAQEFPIFGDFTPRAES